MNVLLDTHAVLWQLGFDENKLGPGATEAMRQSGGVYVSVVSLVEMQIKTMLGKLDAPSDCQRMILEANNKILDLTAVAADAVRKFETLIRHDPFDRFLVAQALSEGMTLITADKILLDLKLDYVLDARK